MNRISVRISSNTILISLFLVIVIVLPNATTISRVAKVCFGIISLIYIFVRRQIFWSYYINWLILTVLLAMCSVIWAISSEYASDGAQTIFFNAVCTFSFIQLLYYNDNWKGIVYRCCAVFPFIRFLALVPEYGVSVLGGLKNIGQDTSYNALGSFGGLGAAICVLLILRSKKGNQIWKIFLFLNIFVCGITMSRKAILYLVIPLLIYYFLSGRNSFIKIRRIVAIIFAIALFYVAVMNVPVLYTYVGSGLESVMKFFNNTGSDSSAVGRSIRIQYGLGWFSQHPLLGYGARNFNYMFAPLWKSSDMVVADNNYIDVLVSFGIIGLIIYYYVHAKTVVISMHNIKRLNNEKIMMLGILITLLICDYGVSSYIYLHSQTYLALVIYSICEDDGIWGYKNKKISFRRMETYDRLCEKDN